MSKNRQTYQCTACGGISPKWAGQCPDCGAWNSLEEVQAVAAVSPRHAGYAGEAVSRIQTLSKVNPEESKRTHTGISELDRVLGGGLVSGSVTLIGGDPGIGKSTLLLQMMAGLAGEMKPLYVTGEESLSQVAMRARRLGVETDLDCLSETSVERIIEHCQARQPKLVVVDSIQTIFTETSQSAPGSVTQVRESAARFVRYAKQTATAVVLVGHVTKEGALAGPRVLEHMVDAVLYFEGDAGARYRVVRAIKNRFGAVNELGVFAMTDEGLKVVSNPSALFLSGQQEPVAGSVVMVTREGTRPLLVEIQALVDNSHLSNPRRVAVGLEQNRLSMLLAVLHRHAGVAIYDQDVFVNVVGGMHMSETASDLPLLMAVLSSFLDRPLQERWVMFGEVGLGGEIRPVYNGEERLKEAQKHGFTHAMIPAGNKPGKISGMELRPVSRLDQAVALLRR